jgi:RNA recognition motif-containing protein
MFASQLFASCGDIVEVHIMKDHVGVSKGYGFVQFSSKKAALKAQKERNGKLVCILSSNPSLPFMAI